MDQTTCLTVIRECTKSDTKYGDCLAGYGCGGEVDVVCVAAKELCRGLLKVCVKERGAAAGCVVLVDGNG